MCLVVLYRLVEYYVPILCACFAAHTERALEFLDIVSAQASFSFCTTAFFTLFRLSLASLLTSDIRIRSRPQKQIGSSSSSEYSIFIILDASILLLALNCCSSTALTLPFYPFIMCSSGRRGGEFYSAGRGSLHG
mmetsp:Transcript_10887/g.16410  ORF Transcript_10887/g.16410 Transcript_10887/m.16410 type:complete len:135 (+) Transcript_10887:12-416(+)